MVTAAGKQRFIPKYHVRNLKLHISHDYNDITSTNVWLVCCYGDRSVFGKLVAMEICAVSLLLQRSMWLVGCYGEVCG